MTKTVLTVDDSRTMRDMLLMALEDAGYTVIQAVDGLVEQQHRRIAELRGGDAEPRAHAQRERSGLLVVG